MTRMFNTKRKYACASLGYSSLSCSLIVQHGPLLCFPSFSVCCYLVLVQANCPRTSVVVICQYFSFPLMVSIWSLSRCICYFFWPRVQLLHYFGNILHVLWYFRDVSKIFFRRSPLYLQL